MEHGLIDFNTFYPFYTSITARKVPKGVHVSWDVPKTDFIPLGTIGSI